MADYSLSVGNSVYNLLGNLTLQQYANGINTYITREYIDRRLYKFSKLTGEKTLSISLFSVQKRGDIGYSDIFDFNSVHAICSYVILMDSSYNPVRFYEYIIGYRRVLNLIVNGLIN